MSRKTTELHIREQTKLVLKHLEHGETEEAQKVILNNKEILRYNFGLINFVPLIPRIRFTKKIPKSNEALKMVIDTGYRIFSQEENVDELLFFAAAKCDTEKLKYCVANILEKNPDGIKQVREGDTALLFLIKYGNIADEKYPECVKVLIEAGIDVNKNDYFSHNPILFLANLYGRYINRAQRDDVVIDNLRRCIEMLLATKAIDIGSLKIATTEMTAKDLLKELQFTDLDYSEVVNIEEQEKDILFKYLVNGDEEAFIKSRKALELLDADDGNNTFLQLCSEKNLKKVAKFLIRNGADLCKTTERNKKTPLELAARRNHPEIFQELLTTNKIVIDEYMFVTFLHNRPKHIKAKYFDEILKYKHLDLKIKSNNGNTPLHYAIIFSSTEAIQILLQRGAPLTVENDSKKTPLDYISAEDLEKHLNRCIIPDSYNDINNGKYELALNYRSLIEIDDCRVTSELAIVEKICNTPKLCHLLNHPLIASFINIKWKLIEPLYQKFFIFHLIFYMISILSFINLSLLTYISLPLALLYGLRILSIFNWKNNKLHEIIDMCIAVTIALSFFISNNIIRYQLGIITTIFMAFSFHLVWRFNPDFSQFHALLINIVTQLFSYVFYILSLILFFGAAFHIFFLVRHEDQFTENYSNNLFTDMQIISPYFYLLCIFAVFIGMMIVMTIINSVTYLQENSEMIRNSFQALGYKHTLIFLGSVEKFYTTNRRIKNPCIFDESYLKEKDENNRDTKAIKKKEKKANKSKNKFLVNFYINTNKFSFEKLLSIKLTDANVFRIKKAINL